MRRVPSIPFRRKAEIGETALRAAEREDLAHLFFGQYEIEDIDIFRQPFDARGARDRADILLHQPAQANLGRRLAVRPADLFQRLAVLDPAFPDRTIGDQRHAVALAALTDLGLAEI